MRSQIKEFIECVVESFKQKPHKTILTDVTKLIMNMHQQGVISLGDTYIHVRKIREASMILRVRKDGESSEEFSDRMNGLLHYINVAHEAHTRFLSLYFSIEEENLDDLFCKPIGKKMFKKINKLFRTLVDPVDIELFEHVIRAYIKIDFKPAYALIKVLQNMFLNDILDDDEALSLLKNAEADLSYTIDNGERLPFEFFPKLDRGISGLSVLIELLTGSYE